MRLSLKAGQPIEETVALIAQLLDLIFLRSRAGNSFLTAARFFLEAIRRIGRRQFMLQIRSLPLIFYANICFPVGLAHINYTWSSNWNLFHVFSFTTLSNSCAI